MRTLAHYFLLFSLIFFFSCQDTDNQVAENTGTSPESLGIKSGAILNFIKAAEEQRPDDLHSFVLLRHGRVAAEGWWAPYRPESPHMLYSLSKSFTSTAIGIAQSEGLLSIDDPVISFFPEDIPDDPSDNLKAMRIRDLLKMNTGHNEDATWRMRQDGDNWVKGFLSLEVEHKPGTHFVYNSAATFMLSAIIQKVTGGTLLEYLTPRLFEPLGIDNPTWETSPQGINTGGWGLSIRTMDIANFGQLYLQEGQWNGEQLVPANWVKEATSYQTSNGSNPNSDWEQGYGYQFWRCRHNVYRGDGAFGQYCIVMPEQDAVLAITSGTDDMQAILNLIWDHLLPAFEEEALPEDEQTATQLNEKLSGLTLSKVEGSADSPLVSGIDGKTFMMDSNNQGLKEIVFNLTGDEKSVVIQRDAGLSSLPVGGQDFTEGSVTIPMMGYQPVATSSGWITGDAYRVKAYLYETPYYFDYEFTFRGDSLIVKGGRNVSFGGNRDEAIRGRVSK